MTETSGSDATDLTKGCELDPTDFMGTNVDYPGIVSYLLSAADGLVFITVLQEN